MNLIKTVFLIITLFFIEKFQLTHVSDEDRYAGKQKTREEGDGEANVMP